MDKSIIQAFLFGVASYIVVSKLSCKCKDSDSSNLVSPIDSNSEQPISLSGVNDRQANQSKQFKYGFF